MQWDQQKFHAENIRRLTKNSQKNIANRVRLIYNDNDIMNKK